MAVYNALVPEKVIAPQLCKKRLPGINAARMRGKGVQQLKFAGRQRQRPARKACLLRWAAW